MENAEIRARNTSRHLQKLIVFWDVLQILGAILPNQILLIIRDDELEHVEHEVCHLA